MTNKEVVYEIPINAGGKKLFFLEEKHAATKARMRKHLGIYATVSRKYGYITFSVDAVEAIGLDHSFLKFYFDKLHRTIGFRVKKELENGEKVARGGWRYLLKNKNGQVRESITTILNEIQPLQNEETYKQLQISKYKDYLSEYKGEELYYYITLK